MPTRLELQLLDHITELTQKLKQSEHNWMVLKDEYSGLVQACDILSEDEFDAWFGDPLIDHELIVKLLEKKFNEKV